MVPEERIAFLRYRWKYEDYDDPESMEWRDDLNAEELALVESFDHDYFQRTEQFSENM